MPKPIKLGGKPRHYQSRFTYGPARQSAKRLDELGPEAWFAEQLKLKKRKDKKAEKLDEWFPKSLGYTPAQMYARDRNGTQPAWQAMSDFSRWTMMRRYRSKRQLHELMVEFWSNLLHIPVDDDTAWIYRIDFDRMIRKSALGRFDRMLAAATTHGAMGLYLDNATSTKDAPNENLGRELLELHTVGVGHFDEADVLNSSRILTGYRVDLWPDLKQWYDAPSHWTGRIRVLDFTHPNRSADGRAATAAYLSYLAHHPATAKRIARRLCVRFVNDEPSADLIRTVARAYTRSDTKIKPTLEAMIDHPEFRKSKRKKVRTPMEDTIGTLRVLRPAVKAPRRDNDFANAFLWVAKSNGQSPFDWAAPNGYPETSPPWASPGRVLDAMNYHRGLVAGWWPSQGVTYRKHTAYLPALPVTMKKLVNHISVEVHNRKAPKSVRKAVTLRTGIAGSRQLSSADVTEILVQQILLTLLDSPAQLKR
ncbi:MAG: DUF1800 domain-containing protein [Nocardioides sp.]